MRIQSGELGPVRPLYSSADRALREKVCDLSPDFVESGCVVIVQARWISIDHLWATIHLELDLSIGSVGNNFPNVVGEVD
jgi:hypothetical protein